MVSMTGNGQENNIKLFYSFAWEKQYLIIMQNFLKLYIQYGVITPCNTKTNG